MKLNILYNDKDILVVYKPAFVSSQEERGSAIDMVSAIKNYYAKELGRQTEVFVVHRLDKPVAGIMVYALNKRAAAKLSEDLSKGGFNKSYYAILTDLPKGFDKNRYNDIYTLTDYLIKDGKNNVSAITKNVNDKAAKKAVLEYRIVKEKIVDNRSLYLAQIELLTGRHHQIRVQFSGNNAPLYGDKKYGRQTEEFRENEGIALCAYKLTFKHPVTQKEMEFSIIPDNSIFGRFFND